MLSITKSTLRVVLQDLLEIYFNLSRSQNNKNDGDTDLLIFCLLNVKMMVFSSQGQKKKDQRLL